MAGHFQSNSSNAERGQVNLQVRSESPHYSAMGNISGGIMRFNISAYNQHSKVDRVRRQQKKDSYHILHNAHGDQVASDVKEAGTSYTS